VSENFSLSHDQFLEKSGVLTLVDNDGDNRLIHGEVARFEQEEQGDRFASYRLILVPKCVFMAFKQNYRIFQDKSVPEILKQVMEESGVSGQNVKLSLSGSYPKRNYCVQYGETDIAFVERLMSEEGLFYFFDHFLDHHCMIIGDKNSVFRTISGASALTFRPKTGMVQFSESIYGYSQCQQAQVRAICPSCSNRVGAVPPSKVCPECGVRGEPWETVSAHSTYLGDFNPEKPQLALSHHANPKGDLQNYRFPGHFSTQSEGKRYAQIELEAACVSVITGEGKTECVRLNAGHLLELKEHPTPVFNRRYLLTKVKHQGAQSQSLEEGASNRGTEYQAHFWTIPNDTTFRVTIQDKPKANDHQTAIVVGPAGEEIYTDALGRIKVQFHWDREGVKDEKSSCWIRVSQGFAGNGYGAVAIPRVGQEVIVHFERGNPDRPIVTGCTYNTLAPAPENLPQHKTRTVFRSNSSPGGDGHNELRIEDKKGKEQIYLHAEKDLDLRVKNDWKQRVEKDQHIIVNKQRNEQVDKDRHYAVGGNSSIKIGKSLSMDVGKDLHQKSGNNHVQQAQQTHFKASTTLVVDGGMSMTLKGGSGTIFLSPAGVSITGPLVRINSGGGGGGAQAPSVAKPEKPKSPVDDNPGWLAKPAAMISGGGAENIIIDHRAGG